MNELPIIILGNVSELEGRHEVGIAGEFENVKRARKWIREEASPGSYLLVRRVETKTVSMVQTEMRVVI